MTTRQPTPQPGDVTAAGRLDAIEARAAKATAGPWFPYAHVLVQEPMVVTDKTRPSFSRVAQMDKGVEDYGLANAEFIAHAREDVPALVAFAREVTALADAWFCSGVPADKIREALARHLDES